MLSKHHGYCFLLTLQGSAIGSSHKKGILKDTVSNKSNLPGLGSPLSRSGSYLGTLDKLQDQNESLGFHCSFETDGSSEQDVDIPSIQPVSYDRILENKGINIKATLYSIINSATGKCSIWFLFERSQLGLPNTGKY